MICNLTYIECQQYLLCRTLGQGQSGPSLHREKSPGSTASLCYCQWLGAVLLYEASLPWQSPGEHNGACTLMQTESAEKHTEFQTNLNPFCAALVFINFLYISACQQFLWKKQTPDWQMLQVPVPPEWVDAIFPRVRALLDTVQARNARMQSGKRQADDLISDRAAEGFLQTVLYTGICFWQNLPFRTQR